MKMICDFCGFDPVLYKREPARAAEKVKAFIEARKTDPKMLLKPYPKLEPIKKRAVDPFLAVKGVRSNLPKVKSKASVAEKTISNS